MASKTRFFVNYPLSDESEVPSGSVVKHSPGANIDYLSTSHEMNQDCDCKHCIAMFKKG